MKSILFTFAFPFHPQRGGTERVADSLARALIKRGYRVLYLCAKYPESYRDYDYPTRVNTLPNPDIHSEENYLFYENFLRENSVDIVINHAHVEGYRLFLHRVDDIKRVTVIHSRPSTYYHTLYQRRNDSLKERCILLLRVVMYTLLARRVRFWHRRAQALKFISGNSDFVSLLSEKYRDEFLEFAPATPLNKLIAIPNPNSYPPQETLAEKRKMLLFVGRLTLSDKRFDRAVSVWRRLYRRFPDWEMVFVGDGDDRGYLDEVVKGVERVRCVGFQDPKPYYEQAAILSLTSNFEGFPLVLTEAMVHGVVPILFSSFASATDIVEDGVDGLLVKPFSLAEYTQKLALLMGDEERLAQLSSRARQSAAKFDIERVTDCWEEVIKKV